MSDQSMREDLLCNEVWVMSPNNALDHHHINAEKNEEYCNNAKGHVSIISAKQDCEEAIAIFLDKEATYMPEPGYLNFVKTNDVILIARLKAVHWLVKCQRRMNLSAATVFLAVNYMDRFISVTDQCQGWRYWTFDLLTVACLSIAAKFSETTTCLLHDEFQAAGMDNCFAPTLIQRMELTVLKALGWRMGSTTPFSYVHLLIQTIDFSDEFLVEDLTGRVTELLLTALLDPDILEFHQCVVAMSAVRCVVEDLLPSTNKGSSLIHLDSVIRQDQKEYLIKCQRIMTKILVHDHNKMFGSGQDSWHGSSSPVTVLKVEWFDFYNYPVDLSFLNAPEINIDLRSNERKRKREEVDECGM